MKDYYSVLGIQPTASSEEIKEAYRKLSLTFHPDKNDGDAFLPERFKEISEAYEVLKEPDARQQYDQQRNRCLANSQNGKEANLLPEIQFFKCDKNVFEYGEEVTFSWKTSNANKVEILPLGQGQPVGSKTCELKNFKNPSLSFEIVARNSFLGKECRATLTLRNETYFQLKKYFQEQLEKDSSDVNLMDSGATKKGKLEKLMGKLIILAMVFFAFIFILRILFWTPV